MKIEVLQDSICCAGFDIISDRADRHRHHTQKNLTPRSLRLESWRLRGAPVTNSLSHLPGGVERLRVTGSRRKDPHMEAPRPLSFKLLPSTLTMLRIQLNMNISVAATKLGLEQKVVQYIEAHTRVFAPDTWSDFNFALTPVKGPEPISIFDYLAELDADQVQVERGDA